MSPLWREYLAVAVLAACLAAGVTLALVHHDRPHTCQEHR